jgi:hypothetical protein
MEFSEQFAEKKNTDYLEFTDTAVPEWVKDFEKFWLMSEEVGLNYSLTEVQSD